MKVVDLGSPRLAKSSGERIPGGSLDTLNKLLLVRLGLGVDDVLVVFTL